MRSASLVVDFDSARRRVRRKPLIRAAMLLVVEGALIALLVVTLVFTEGLGRFLVIIPYVPLVVLAVPGSELLAYCYVWRALANETGLQSLAEQMEQFGWPRHVALANVIKADRDSIRRLVTSAEGQDLDEALRSFVRCAEVALCAAGSGTCPECGNPVEGVVE